MNTLTIKTYIVTIILALITIYTSVAVYIDTQDLLITCTLTAMLGYFTYLTHDLNLDTKSTTTQEA